MTVINLSESIKTKVPKINRNIKNLIEICGGEEIGKFLLYLPSKYIQYKLISLNEDFINIDYIPVIYGKVISSSKRKNNIFYKIIDYKSKKEFMVYFKVVPQLLKINHFYYFIGKIYQKEDQEDIIMFFPKYKDNFSNFLEPVYYKMSTYDTNHFKIIIKNICDSMNNKLIIFSNTEYGLNKEKYNIKDMFLTIHNLNNRENYIGEQKSILKLLDYTCFFYQLGQIKNINIGTSKKEKYLLDLKNIILTDCQKKSIKSISINLSKEEKTLNFLQGDVGSGKTLVAFITIRKTMINGYNGCFMSPTSILAYQHYESFKTFFPNVSCFLLCSGYKNKQYKKELEDKINSQIPTIFFGTHNLLYEKIPNVEYIVIDEQHKFGMEQRKILMDYYSSSDILFLSATPIPRTLFMLQNGQMDLFTLKTTPFKRNVITKIIKNRNEILNEVLEISKNSKVIWINGAIDEAARKGVKTTFEYLKQYTNNVYLIHGKLSDEEKLGVIRNFQNGILVATICVETGIDLPNVPLIIIEEAENFGLATLHQLRGRVGRKGEPSQCILITEKHSERLEILCETNDGFKIAEMDLLQRGYGSFFQKQQWGFDNFKSGKLNQKLFKIASEITKNQQYNKEIIEEFSKFFLKITNVNY